MILALLVLDRGVLALLVLDRGALHWDRPLGDLAVVASLLLVVVLG